MRGIFAYECKPTHPGPPANRLFCRDWMYSNYKCKKKQRPEMICNRWSHGRWRPLRDKWVSVSTTSTFKLDAMRFVFKIKTVQGGSFLTNAMIRFCLKNFFPWSSCVNDCAQRARLLYSGSFCVPSIFSVLFFACECKLPSIRVSCSTFLKWHRDEVVKISF